MKTNKTNNKTGKGKPSVPFKSKGNKRYKFNEKDFQGKPISADNTANYVGWYSVNQEVLNDAASFPFSNAIGSKIPGFLSVPGAMFVNFDTYYGPADDGNVALNMAVTNYFSTVRSRQTGAVPYESSDLMIYLLAAGEIMSMIAAASRRYGIAKKFNLYNEYLPKGLFDNLGTSSSEVIDNAANFRLKLNIIIEQFNQTIKVPKNFPLFARRVLLNESVFVNTDGNKYQLVIPVQRAYGVFSATEFETGSALIEGAQYDFSLDQLSQIITDLGANQDIRTMSGDLERRFENEILQLDPISEDYTTPFIYDDMMNCQFHNLKTAMMNVMKDNGTTFSQTNLEYLADPTGGVVTQDKIRSYPVVYQRNNKLFCQGFITATTGGSYVNEDELEKASSALNDVLLDFSVDRPAPADIMEGSRLTLGLAKKPTLKYTTETSNLTTSMYPIIAGSEIVVAVSILAMESGNISYLVTDAYSVNYIPEENQNLDPSQLRDLIRTVGFMSQFKHSPLLYITDSIVGKIDSFSVINAETGLRNLHKAAILGEMRIPNNAIVVKKST
nr:putative capsid [Marmot picobirnavirus]